MQPILFFLSCFCFLIKCLIKDPRVIFLQKYVYYKCDLLILPGECKELYF